MDKTQEYAMELFQRGFNLFITGGAGTGKSFLIKCIYDRFSVEKQIGLTSLTGVSALLIGGTTIHSYFGLGLYNDTIPIEVYVKKIKDNPKLYSRILDTKVLIIDEVSMMEYSMLWTMDLIAREIRKCNKPMGGIQVLLVGDFFQLPPVNCSLDTTKKYVFQHPVWNEIIDENIVLDTIHRQNERQLIDILNNIRIGNVDKRVRKYLNQLRVDTENPIENLDDFPHLKSLKRENNEINLTKLRDLKSIETVYNGRIFDKKNNRIEKSNSNYYWPKSINFEEELKVKIGAIVMVCYNVNITGGIVNGSIGKIVDFQEGYPVVELENGRLYKAEPVKTTFDNIIIEQVPLKLAWSLTIHKSQGATMDSIEVDAGSGIFECGQTYVALSRVKSLEGLYLSAFDVTRIKVNRKVQEFYENMRKMKKERDEKDELNNQMIQELNMSSYEYKSDESKENSNVKIVKIHY
jgi:ATP-dependent DNA helicase PIF1